MKVHELPACTPLSATYKTRSGATETLDPTGISITCVLKNKDGTLESNQLGISAQVKISVEQLNITPKKRDRITINNSNYIVEAISLRANNPVLDDFYDMLVKSESNNAI